MNRPVPRMSRTQTSPSLEDVVRFVRDFTGTRRTLEAETRLDADLGVTGDDGEALLEAAESRFSISLSTARDGIRRTFDLGPNEYLLGPEGLDPLGITVLLRWLRGEPKPMIRDVTIAELHEAIMKASPFASCVQKPQ